MEVTAMVQSSQLNLLNVARMIITTLRYLSSIDYLASIRAGILYHSLIVPYYVRSNRMRSMQSTNEAARAPVATWLPGTGEQLPTYLPTYGIGKVHIGRMHERTTTWLLHVVRTDCTPSCIVVHQLLFRS